MLDPGNRTFIGSVVFVDIVGYTKRSVSEQIAFKDRFTNLLTESLKDIEPEQRIILDTGDGAALSFLGDPEDALFVSMHMRDCLKREEKPVEGEAPKPEANLRLRIGVNLGPVKLIRDINGQPNIVGDGINVAQRIMSFADPGQIVVSRSYFDVVSVISDQYANLFKYEGSRTDKHVREHEIYIVGESDAAFNQAKAGMAGRAAQTASRNKAAEIGASTNAYAAQTNAQGTLTSLPQKRNPLTIAGVILGIIILALAIAIATKKPAETPAIARTASESAKLEQAKNTDTKTESQSIDTQSAPAKSPADTGKLADVANTATRNSTGSPTDTATSGDKKSIVKAEPTKSDAAKTEVANYDQPKTVAQGSVSFSILPWGEITIDNKSIGASPPVKQIKLSAGKHQIKITNGSLPPYVTNVDVKPKEEISIKYKFQ